MNAVWDLPMSPSIIGRRLIVEAEASARHSGCVPTEDQSTRARRLADAFGPGVTAADALRRGPEYRAQVAALSDLANRAR